MAKKLRRKGKETEKIASTRFLYVFDGAFDGMPGKLAVAGFPSTPKDGSVPEGKYAVYIHTTEKRTYTVYVHIDLEQRGLTDQALLEAHLVIYVDVEPALG